MGKIILARTHKVRAFVGMNYRLKRHLTYVSKTMAELHSSICKEAIMEGYVDDTKRDKLLKYKQHYEYFKGKENI